MARLTRQCTYAFGVNSVQGFLAVAQVLEGASAVRWLR